MSCPRNISKDDLIAGLKAGNVACIDRKDAPELEDLAELEAQGLVESWLVELDEQSTVRKFRWKAPACDAWLAEASLPREREK